MPHLTLTALCLIGGHTLAWRFSYFAVVPGTIAALILSALIGEFYDDGFGWTAFYVLLNITLFQAGNLAAILFPASPRRAGRSARAFIGLPRKANL